MVAKLQNLTDKEVEELRQEALKHYWMHNRQVTDLKEPGALKVMTEGEGCWVPNLTVLDTLMVFQVYGLRRPVMVEKR